MSWLKKEDKKAKEDFSSIPELPELPKLPEFPSLNSITKNTRELPPQLPLLPGNNYPEKYSQNAIKEAISGKKSEGEKVDELEEIGIPIAPKFKAKEYNEKNFEEKEFERFGGIQKKQITSIKPTQKKEVYSEEYEDIPKEPVFIRLDRFEESMKIFNKAKITIDSIEETLRNIKDTKEKEEKELKQWEEEISNIKEQIEKIDREIFSKIE
jgi:hypothetical protein